MTRRLALDVEGDGQNPSNIVQLALSELDDFRPTGRHYAWMVKPPGEISCYATRVHGIRDSDVAGLGLIDTFLGEIAEALRDDPIVGHNVRGDYRAVKRVLPDWEPLAGYDTFRLAKNRRPGLSSYKLVAVGDALGLTTIAEASFPNGPHTAPFDALLAGLISHELTHGLSPKALHHVLTHSNIFNFRSGSRKAVSDDVVFPGLLSGPR